MGTTIEINESLIKAVDAIPLTLRNGPLGKCLGAFGETIARACKSQARSSRGGSRLKWSKKYKNDPAFQNDSRDRERGERGSAGSAAHSAGAEARSRLQL